MTYETLEDRQDGALIADGGAMNRSMNVSSIWAAPS
jgi:hypothetical protein